MRQWFDFDVHILIHATIGVSTMDLNQMLFMLATCPFFLLAAGGLKKFSQLL
jgi:hypothetical protein